MSDYETLSYNISKITIFLSYLVALMIDIIVISTANFYWVPPLTLLTLIYWSSTDLKHSFILSSFILGLMHDILHQSLLGVHSFSFIIIIFIVLHYRLRFRLFTQLQQALFFMLLMYLYQLILLAFKPVLLAYNLDFWLAPLSIFVIWPILTLTLGFFRRDSLVKS